MLEQFSVRLYEIHPTTAAVVGWRMRKNRMIASFGYGSAVVLALVATNADNTDQGKHYA